MTSKGDGAGPAPRGGALHLVATPIGNLGDVSARALDTLRACDVILAEDTRRARQLLSHFAILGKKLRRLDAHAEKREAAAVVLELSRGASVALVTDAGTPTVSDPGGLLVERVVEAGLRVVPIPGPSAALAGLAASGLAGEGAFRFVGFLPREGPARHAALSLICETPEAVVLFESPARTEGTLRELADATPDRRACVARELTKVHEEFVRGTLRELAAGGRSWLGEVVIVLGAHDPKERIAHIDDTALDERIDEALATGQHLKTIAEVLAAWSGRPKRELYARIVERRGRKK